MKKPIFLVCPKFIKKKKMEKQELTCNSTVIARPLLAHVSLFSSSEEKNKSKGNSQGKKINTGEKKTENQFIDKKLRILKKKKKLLRKYNCPLQALYGIILLGMKAFMQQPRKRVCTTKQKPRDPEEAYVLLSHKNHREHPKINKK
jgi:hypothetical protein